jgi:hypothetical protein
MPDTAGIYRNTRVSDRREELSPVAREDRTDGKCLLLEEGPHAAREQHGGDVCGLLRDQEATRPIPKLITVAQDWH